MSEVGKGYLLRIVALLAQIYGLFLTVSVSLLSLVSSIT